MWLYQLQDVLEWDDTLAACLKELSKRFPLETPEWKQWTASRPKAGEGKWVVSGYQAGKGAYGGEIELKKTGDAFYSYAGAVEFENGEKQPISGKATLYGGYAVAGDRDPGREADPRGLPHLHGRFDLHGGPVRRPALRAARR